MERTETVCVCVCVQTREDNMLMIMPDWIPGYGRNVRGFAVFVGFRWVRTRAHTHTRARADEQYHRGVPNPIATLRACDEVNVTRDALCACVCVCLCVCV